VPCLVQGVLGAWVQLCEAVASWRMIQDEGLRNELSVIMQAFKANLVGAHFRQGLCWALGPGSHAQATLSLQHVKINPGVTSFVPPGTRICTWSHPALPWSSLGYTEAATGALKRPHSMQVGQWEQYWGLLDPPVRDKLAMMCCL
jgi:hypothetical protein